MMHIIAMMMMYMIAMMMIVMKMIVIIEMIAMMMISGLGRQGVFIPLYTATLSAFD